MSKVMIEEDLYVDFNHEEQAYRFYDFRDSGPREPPVVFDVTQELLDAARAKSESSV